MACLLTSFFKTALCPVVPSYWSIVQTSTSGSSSSPIYKIRFTASLWIIPATVRPARRVLCYFPQDLFGIFSYPFSIFARICPVHRVRRYTRVNQFLLPVFLRGNYRVLSSYFGLVYHRFYFSYHLRFQEATFGAVLRRATNPKGAQIRFPVYQETPKLVLLTTPIKSRPSSQ